MAGMETGPLDDAVNNLRRWGKVVREDVDDLLARVSRLEDNVEAVTVAVNRQGVAYDDPIPEGAVRFEPEPEPEPEPKFRTVYDWEVRDDEFEVLAHGKRLTYAAACAAAGRVAVPGKISIQVLITSRRVEGVGRGMSDVASDSRR